jgi:L-seryl-tRNA(Ser) seleniumtransferase
MDTDVIESKGMGTTEDAEDTEENPRAKLSLLPGVDRVLADEALASLRSQLSVEHLTAIIRQAVDQVREDVLGGGVVSDDLKQDVFDGVKRRAAAFLAPSLKRVINGTGVVLHTNMGRAPLPQAAIDRIAETAGGYTNLELDLESGDRGSRTTLIESLVCRLTGAEAAAFVNNNAAAVLLALNTLAQGKEAVVSRGQLVEIGGSFRIPDIMERSGARMVEVGTTNRTHPKDFEDAITEETGLLLSVHPSNYEVVGFTSEVELKELVRIGHERGVPILHDLGAGCLVDTRSMGLGYEPLVSDSVEAGADVITFSGDKVLGGPQCGILVGKTDAIERVRKNPLMRALRCDKMTYAALEATLQLFLDENQLQSEHPVMRMLMESVDDVRVRAQDLVAAIGTVPAVISVIDSDGQVGSGALPIEKVASAAVRIEPERCSVDDLARQLRGGTPAVVGYTRGDVLHLDTRTISADDIADVAQAVRSALGMEA